MSEYVRFGAGSTGAGGVYAAPAGPAPVVLVTTAIAGINDYVRGIVDRLAAEGYAALALDYYADSQVPDLSTPERVMAAVGALRDPDVLADMRAGLGWARREASSGRAAVLGFCIGGSYSLLAAAELDGLACAVSFYGMLRYQQHTPNKPHSPLDAAARARCPLLGHFGDEDHLVPVADARELAELTHGVPAEIYTYPGAGHAFHEDFRPGVYRPVAAETAWRRTLSTLGYYLRSPHTAPR